MQQGDQRDTWYDFSVLRTKKKPNHKSLQVLSDCMNLTPIILRGIAPCRLLRESSRFIQRWCMFKCVECLCDKWWHDWEWCEKWAVSGRTRVFEFDSIFDAVGNLILSIGWNTSVGLLEKMSPGQIEDAVRSRRQMKSRCFRDFLIFLWIITVTVISLSSKKITTRLTSCSMWITVSAFLYL